MKGIVVILAAVYGLHGLPRCQSKPLVEDWPGFLGPRRDGTSLETGLQKEFPAEGLELVWALPRGSGYAGPAIAEERLVYTHREAGEAVVVCVEAATGALLWERRYPCDYAGKFIRNSGPRATPLIAGDKAFVHGVEGRLLSFELESGEIRWQRDTHAEFGSEDDFFGVVSSPLLHGGLLIQQVGSHEGATVVALDPDSGETRWELASGWRPSCSSPTVGLLGGEERLFVLAGGESRPPVGGLLVLDPSSGALQHQLRFRSRRELSVVGATPVVGAGCVLVTDGYGAGSVALEIDGEGAWRTRWRSRRGFEFTNPLFVDGNFWAVDGVSGRAGAITCLDPATGEEVVRKELYWTEQVRDGGRKKELSLSIGQGSILAVDDALLCLGDDGALLWVQASRDSIEVLDRTRLFHALETWTPPVVWNGKLYVCQNNRERFGDDPEGPRLLCFELRAPGE